MAGEIKQKIVLEGEAEYNKALKDAQRELKRLRTELKAESAELDANGKSQDKAKAKQDSLKKQIAEQAKVVEMLKKALAEAKKDYGDNADVVAKWENKLNEARATLANMQKELNDLGADFQSVSSSTEMGVVATQSFAEAIGSISDVAGSVADKCSDIFSGVVSVISEAVHEIWDTTFSVAAKANNWNDIAGFWGTSGAEVAQYEKAISGVGDEFDDLLKAINQIALGGKEKDIAEMLQIDKTNYQSDWEFAIACVERLVQLQDEGNKMDDIYSTIFGKKKAEGVMDIVNDWEAIQVLLDKYNAEEGGLGMNQSTLDTMDSLYQKMSDLKTTWETLRESFTASIMGEIGIKLADDAESVLGSFFDVMNAEGPEEREEALTKMKDDVSQFFTDLAGAIRDGIKAINDVAKELQTSSDPTTKAIGDVVAGITEAFSWLTDPANWRAIETGVKAFFAIWGASEILTAVGTITKLAASLSVIQGFKGLKGLGSLGGLGTGAGGGLLSGITAGGVALTLTLATAAITIANAAINTNWGKVKEDNDKLDEFAKENGYDNYTEASVKTFIESDADARKDATKDLWSILTTGKMPSVEKAVEEGAENGVREAMTMDNSDDTNLAWYMDRRTRQQKSFFNADQAEAAQAWWDVFKQDPLSEGADSYWGNLESLFAGQDMQLDHLDALIENLQQALNQGEIDYSTVEDLPEWWFDPSKYGGPSSQDYASMTSAVNGMPDKVAAAVRKGVSGITITLNGASVGQAVAPEVSRFIASYIV